MQPVASVCKVIALHLMSLAVETFSEESLGNSEVCGLVYVCYPVAYNIYMCM